MPHKRPQTGPEPFDTVARQSQVSGKPRLKPLTSDEFSDDAREIVAQIRETFGSKDDSDVPPMFATLFRHPGLFRGQMLLGQELNRNGRLPGRERELAILRVAWLARSPFEWGEHVEYGKAHGLTDDDIARVTQGSDAPGWTDHDRAIVLAVEELMGDHAISEDTWNLLAASWNEAQLIELPGLVGAYSMTAMIYNTLRFDLLPGNGGFQHY